MQAVIQDESMNPESKLTRWNELPDVLTTEQVAIFLQISDNTVKRMFKDDELKAVKLSAGWRVNKMELMKLMQISDKDAPQLPMAVQPVTVAKQVKRFPDREIITDLRLAAELVTAEGHEDLVARLLAYADRLANLDDLSESDDSKTSIEPSE